MSSYPDAELTLFTSQTPGNGEVVSTTMVSTTMGL